MKSQCAEEEHGENEATERRQRTCEPTERTRLLPQGVYLDPDDPGVSPYNLWSVRALRSLNILFLIITLIWWIVLLASTFVSPPGMNSRGPGFLDFFFATLTMGNLLIALIFFSVPSRPMTIWGAVLSLFLAVNLFIIVGVRRLRIEEGWVGIASATWATVVSLYLLAQTRFVAWGKREEEERLTGREETRRTLREWFAVLLETIVVTVTALATVLLMATLSVRAKDAGLPAPGNKYYVDNGKYQIHLDCVGAAPSMAANKRSATVLLEAGEMPVEDSFRSWVHEAFRNGSIDRYCYWDRPGIGWSDNAPSPHSAGMSADVLSETLALADIKGSWGRRIRWQLGKPGRGFKLWLRGIFSPLGLDSLAGAIFKGRTREDRVYGKVAYQNGKFIKAKLQENLVADSTTKSEISSAKNIQSPSMQLVVVSSGIEVRSNQKWADKQKELTNITDNLVAWDIVKNAPHEVWRTDNGKALLGDRLKKLVKP
ncbi:predicted protein [Histoplasma mississippiense (nom. inval.)]|uniref:predicted protein n=1 Tax=Ajellomyces capsulatus (strain NAm1 / WU24) TaxID=2059318 RepID=UPI000157C4E6|nr:predicted protein [Histoplasma mississippiense (nom. inval.)]EDN08237.1 predicted protein [Histoplasma mississippiense (nom. inval.)]